MHQSGFHTMASLQSFSFSWACSGLLWSPAVGPNINVWGEIKAEACLHPLTAVLQLSQKQSRLNWFCW